MTSPSRDPPAATDRLRIGLLTPVRTVDPLEAMDASSGLASDQIFETAYRHVGVEALPEPVLLRERLTVERTGPQSIELHGRVRAEARFSDGTPLTGEAAAAALSRAASLMALADVRHERDRIMLVPRSGVTRERIERELCKRPTAMVLRTERGPLGTGPYALAPSTDPATASLVASPHARRRAPIARIDLTAYADADALAAAIASGEVGFTTELGRDRATALVGVVKRFVHGTGTAILFFNVEHPALAEPAMRARLAAAVDARALTEEAFGNAPALTMQSLLPPQFGLTRPPRHRAGPTSAPLPERLRLLTMWGPRPYLPLPLVTAHSIARQLATLGVAVDVEATRSAQDAVERVIARDYDLFLAGWMADGPDPSDFLFALLHSSCIPAPGSPVGIACNLARWRSADVDDALAQYRRTAERAALERVLDLVDEQVPLLPLMCGPTIVVHGWHVRPGPIGAGSLDLAEFSLEQ